jgi:hypothetical protein
MLEQKVKEIIIKQESLNEINKRIADCDMQKIGLMNELFKAKQEIASDKLNLGRIIAPITQNIIMEINNKIYCVFFNRKYGTAGIIEAVSAKDAEIKLCINKMEIIK